MLIILDAYSRRVIRWALDDTLEAKLAIKALRRALADRPVPASLVHHSDRGVQYCSGVYVEILRSHGIRISMSRSGNPYDNALAERFMRTLKCEEVYLNDRIKATPPRQPSAPLLGGRPTAGVYTPLLAITLR